MRPGGTRVPTPNTRVKARAADGTVLGTAWESRWLPDLLLKTKMNKKLSLYESIRLWGRSSVGRAPALQAGGQEFESLRLHSREQPAEACTLKTPYRSEMGKRNLSKKKRYQAYRHPRNKQARKKQACMQESMQAEESKNAATLCSRRGQARKGAGRMPWH